MHRYLTPSNVGLALSCTDRMCVTLFLLNCSASLASLKLPIYRPGRILFIPFPMAAARSSARGAAAGALRACWSRRGSSGWAGGQGALRARSVNSNTDRRRPGLSVHCSPGPPRPPGSPTAGPRHRRPCRKGLAAPAPSWSEPGTCHAGPWDLWTRFLGARLGRRDYVSRGPGRRDMTAGSGSLQDYGSSGTRAQGARAPPPRAAVSLRVPRLGGGFSFF